MTIPALRTENFEYAIRDLAAEADRLEKKGQQVIRLNIGDPQAFGFRPPENVIEAVRVAIKDNFTGYAHSAGLLRAREAVAEYATGLGAETSPDEVILTSGTSEAADLILTALLDPGDEILLPAPGYPLYPAIAGRLGASVRYYRLDPVKNWQPAPNEILSRITRLTKAIVLVNPNNPTGAITPDILTSEILEIAESLEILIISDEVYRELCFSDPPTSVSFLAKESEVSVITLESLSKTHMLSGWRIGWMRFTNGGKIPELISAITRLASSRLCSPTIAQYAVEPALNGSCRDYSDGFLSQIKRRRDLAVELVERTPRLSCFIPEAAFYLMVKADDREKRLDQDFVKDLLRTMGVLVIHGSGFGGNPHDGYFRLVYLPCEEVLTNAIGKIGGFLNYLTLS